MKNLLITIVVLVASLTLAACGDGAAQENKPAESTTVNAATPNDAATPILNEGYKDALPAAAQLILGSLKLEQEKQAIDASEAAKLLPLWRAYQSLSQKDTTAPTELKALVEQIQNTMSPEQVQAIAAMQLTSSNIGEILQTGGPGLFGGSENRDRSGSTNARGEGFAGPPPGAFPDGGPGGGPGGPGGGFFGGGQGASPEARATAIAQRLAQGGDQAASFITRGMLNQLITSLRLKTGELTQADLQAQQAQRVVLRWLPQVAQTTGISADVLQKAVSAGATLAEAIKAQGGDVAAVESALREALKQDGRLDDQAITKEMTTILNTKAPAPSQ